MNIIECEQGSPEWHRARAGAITGSKVALIRARVGVPTEQQAKYIAAIKAGLGTAAASEAAGYKKTPTASCIERALAGLPVGEFSNLARDYAFHKAVERISGEPLDDDEYSPWQADRGIRLEPEARAEHEVQAGVLVMPCGFIATDDGKFGASADGLIGDKEGAEYKAFIAPKKLRAVLIDGDIGEVRQQCQFNMAVSGRGLWHYGLYCPALRVIGKQLTLIQVPRNDDFIDEMWKDLLEFDALICQYEAALRDSDRSHQPLTEGAAA